MSGKSWEDMAREVLVQGRPADIGSAALGWKELIKNVGQVKESLEQNVRDLGVAWKGPAYEAFKTHIEGIAKDAGRIIDEVDKPGSGRESIVTTLETAARQLEEAQAKMPVPQSCVGDLMAARNGELTLDTGLFETSVRADFMGSWPVEQIGKFNDWVTEWFADNTGEARKAYNEVNGHFKDRTMDTPGGNARPDISNPTPDIPELGGGPGAGGAGGVPSVGGMPSTGGMGGAPSVSAGGMPGTGSGIGSGAHPDLSSGGYGSGAGSQPGTGAYPGAGGLGEEYGTGLAGAPTATAPGIGTGGGLPSTSGLGGGSGAGLAGGAGGGMIAGGGALGRPVSPVMPPMMGGAAGAGKGAGGRAAGGRLGGAGRPGAGGMMPGVGGGMAGAGRGATGGRGGANATAGGRGAGARGGMAGMGHGGGAGYGEEEAPRNNWLEEDEDVWGADGGGTPGVLR